MGGVGGDGLGDLARAAGDSTTADQHYRAQLAIAERLATTYPATLNTSAT